MSELAAIVDRTTGERHRRSAPGGDSGRYPALQQIVREVPIAPSVRDYALLLVAGSHPGSEHAPGQVNRYVRYGASPRAAQAIILCAKVNALMAGRFNVSRGDIKKVALPALRHRILVNYEAEADGITSDSMVDSLLQHADKLDREPIAV